MKGSNLFSLSFAWFQSQPEKVNRYTDNSFRTIAAVDQPAVLGHNVYYGLKMSSPITGIFMYIDTCTFGNLNDSRDVFQPYVSTRLSLSFVF